MQTTTGTTQEDSSTEAIVDRYLALFTETDPDARSELAHAVCADECELVDPLLEAEGPARIAAAIGVLQDQMPGHSLARTTAVDAHHAFARFGWTVTGPDGNVAITGIDVVTFAPDGRIRSAVGFFGELTPAP